MNVFFFSLTGLTHVPSFLANTPLSEAHQSYLVLVSRPDYSSRSSPGILLAAAAATAGAGPRPTTRTLRETCTNSDI